TPTATPGSSGFPTTAILDNFDRNNGGLGSKWNGSPAGYAVNANRFDVNSGGDIYWSPTVFGADQEVFITLTAIDANALEIDLLLKGQSSTYWGGGVLEVWYYPTDQIVQVWTFAPSQGWVQHGASIPVAFADGDQFGARATADGQVAVYRNGTLLATRSVASWPFAASGGYIGLWFANASSTLGDDFGGGNVNLV